MLKETGGNKPIREDIAMKKITETTLTAKGGAWIPDEPNHPVWTEVLKLQNNPDEVRLKTKLSNFPFAQAVGCTGLAVHYHTEDTSYRISYPVWKKATVFGIRSLTNARQSGYDLEGRVSVRGKKVRAFTSRLLIEYNGHLTDVGELYVCLDHKQA